MKSMMEVVRPGATEGTIAGEGMRAMAELEGLPYDIAITSGAKSHLYWNPGGPPHWDCRRQLQAGEMIHMDLWGPVRGYYTDFARSTIVGGVEPTPEQRHIIEAPLSAVHHLTSAIKPGVTVGELFDHGERWLVENDWLGGATRMEDAVGTSPLLSHCAIFGHGIGLSNERPWIVRGDPTVLQKNMTLAIEVILCKGEQGAYLEHNIVVTDDGCEILDAACPERWWS
jgi:Xaa-Pro aminopeptidase